MTTRAYQVQTWNDDGTLKDKYQVELETTTELQRLVKFLRTTAAHVVVTTLPAKKKPPIKRSKK